MVFQTHTFSYRIETALLWSKPSPVNCYVTRTELTKRHKQFMHPSAEKLLNLFKKWYSHKVNTELKEQISANQETCSEYAVLPFRFRAVIGKENIFIYTELAMDVLWLANKPVIHIVDIKTGFHNAVFIEDKTATNLWNDFVNCWDISTTDFPKTIRLDRVTIATSNEFRGNAHYLGIHCLTVQKHKIRFDRTNDTTIHYAVFSIYFIIINRS